MSVYEAIEEIRADEAKGREMLRYAVQIREYCSQRACVKCVFDRAGECELTTVEDPLCWDVGGPISSCDGNAYTVNKVEEYELNKIRVDYAASDLLRTLDEFNRQAYADFERTLNDTSATFEDRVRVLKRATALRMTRDALIAGTIKDYESEGK